MFFAQVAASGPSSPASRDTNSHYPHYL